jgi:hypothetical protein
VGGQNGCVERGAARTLARFAHALPGARAETVKNNLNPKFTTPVVVDFFFEEVSYVKFEVRGTCPKARAQKTLAGT